MNGSRAHSCWGGYSPTWWMMRDGSSMFPREGRSPSSPVQPLIRISLWISRISGAAPTFPLPKIPRTRCMPWSSGRSQSCFPAAPTWSGFWSTTPPAASMPKSRKHCLRGTFSRRSTPRAASSPMRPPRSNSSGCPCPSPPSSNWSTSWSPNRMNHRVRWVSTGCLPIPREMRTGSWR